MAPRVETSTALNKPPGPEATLSVLPKDSINNYWNITSIITLTWYWRNMNDNLHVVMNDLIILACLLSWCSNCFLWKPLKRGREICFQGLLHWVVRVLPASACQNKNQRFRKLCFFRFSCFFGLYGQKKSAIQRTEMNWALPSQWSWGHDFVWILQVQFTEDTGQTKKFRETSSPSK